MTIENENTEVVNGSEEAPAVVNAEDNTAVTPENVEPEKDSTLIGRVYNKDFAALKDDIEKVVAAKIYDKINAKKQEFINTVRGDLQGD
jgi:hypothetical protein